MHEMIKIAHSNQKRWHEIKLGAFSDARYKKFNSVKKLLNTLPSLPIKAVNKFMEKHHVFPITDSHKHGYIFNMQGASFDGPFVNENHFFFLQQKNPDRPIFMIEWVPAWPKTIQITFYTINSDKSYSQYKVLTTQNDTLILENCITNQTVYKYQLDVDGNLVKRIT